MNDFRVRIAECRRIHLGDEHKMVWLRQQSGGGGRGECSGPGGLKSDGRADEWTACTSALSDDMVSASAVVARRIAISIGK
jgi:hypothetical protein